MPKEEQKNRFMVELKNKEASSPKAQRLNWAIEHQCFNEGMQHLESLSSDAWNYCDLDGWDYMHPWRKGDM